MTYKTHAHNISPMEDIPPDGIGTRDKRELALRLAEQATVNVDDAAISQRYASAMAIHEKSIRDNVIFNKILHQEDLENSQKQETHDHNNTPSSEDDAAARAALADALFKLQHAAVNEAAMEQNNREDGPPSL